MSEPTSDYIDPAAAIPTSRTIDARWTAEETEPAAIAEALRRLEATRRPDGSSVAPARALTLVVLLELEHDDEVRRQLKALGTNRASRTIVVRRCPDRATIGGRAAVIADDEIGTGLRETIVLDIGPAHELDLDGILDPLVLTDAPTVAWAPHGDPGLLLLLRGLVQAVIIDGDDAPSVREALDDARDLREAGLRTIDLAWLRSSPWRVRLASLAQEPYARARLFEIAKLEIEARADSRVCGALLAGWMADRLQWQPGPPLLDLTGHRVCAELSAVQQEVRGLHGVSLTYRSGAGRRLARGPGGLQVTDRAADGSTDVRTVMGGSRGGAGLLPSALRQVLLPDELDEEVLQVTAALDAARVLTQVDR